MFHGKKIVEIVRKASDHNGLSVLEVKDCFLDNTGPGTSKKGGIIKQCGKKKGSGID